MALRNTQVAKEVLYQGGTLRNTQVVKEVLQSRALFVFNITLLDASETPIANLTDLSWDWFDEDTLDALTAPTDSRTGATTDSNGVLHIGLINTSVASGQSGTLIIQTNDGLKLAFVNIQIP
mgnify:CR=1 FL=1